MIKCYINPPTKHFVKLVKCFSLFCYVMPLLLVRAIHFPQIFQQSDDENFPKIFLVCPYYVIGVNTHPMVASSDF
jgi:hypothetical protein